MNAKLFDRDKIMIAIINKFDTKRDAVNITHTAWYKKLNSLVLELPWFKWCVL